MVAALKKNFILSSVFFCASLNHKQMSLYYAPAIFAHLFGNCLKQKTLTRKVYLKLRLINPSIGLIQIESPLQ